MKLGKKIFNMFVYHLTEKPKHYVHVDKVNCFQDLRQIQYNNWCKAKGVYCGSYLPKNPDSLVKNGWVDITNINNKANRNFVRKSSGQSVRYDPENEKQIGHYHWHNPKPEVRCKKIKTKYLDRYGLPCTERDKSHHLAPLDMDWPGNIKRWE